LITGIGIETGSHLSGLPGSLPKDYTSSDTERFMAHPRESGAKLLRFEFK
jgi:hypothetical protein